MARKNRYVKNATKSKLLKTIKGEVNPQNDFKATALVTVKDVVLGVLGGGIVAAIAGKFAIPLGIVITGAGHFKNSKMLQVIGLGTMASNSFTKTAPVNGLEGLDGVKERLQALKSSITEKFLLDKLLKKKGLRGLGNVQYFNYPDQAVGELAALDSIENQIIESGMQFQGTNDYTLVDGIDGMDDPLY
ncbi:hypothetical protein [Longitalea luteola]|uniref:hypothetical protein n=1 Tax=Longitalea luteola TaxID=2812563 RepID=UPI001A957AB9|nr:hypothetical protein [Longitalea luteola]